MEAAGLRRCGKSFLWASCLFAPNKSVLCLCVCIYIHSINLQHIFKDGRRRACYQNETIHARFTRMSELSSGLLQRDISSSVLCSLACSHFPRCNFKHLLTYKHNCFYSLKDTYLRPSLLNFTLLKSCSFCVNLDYLIETIKTSQG